MDDDLKKAMLQELKDAGLSEQRTRQPGDLDSKDLAEYLGVSERWAFEKIKKLAKEMPEAWEATLVYDPTQKHQLLVLRKKK